MLRYKKAEFGTLVIIIILIVSGIVIFIFGTKLIDMGKEDAEVETCRLSVLSQANTEVLGTSILSLECARRYVTIYDTHVDKGIQPDKLRPMKILYNGEYTKSFKAINPDIVNYVVAEEMRKCWYQFNEAKTKVFPNNEPVGGDLSIGDDKICFVCDDLRFDLKEDKEFKGLIEFMKLAHVKDQKYTYWEYLNMESISEYTLDQYIFKEYTGVIDTLWGANTHFIFSSDKAYSIIFFKDFDNPNMVLSKNRSGYYVLVLPTDKLNDVCEIQAS